MYILCTKPPTCVLFRQENSKHPGFEDLQANDFPVFPIERSITIKKYSVRRTQVPICPAFSLTDYKVQGATLKIAVLDLKGDPSAKGQDSHKKFCSMVVQLSRPQSLAGLYLLQKLDPSNSMSWDLCRRFWRVLPQNFAAFASRGPLLSALVKGALAGSTERSHSRTTPGPSFGCSHLFHKTIPKLVPLCFNLRCCFKSTMAAIHPMRKVRSLLPAQRCFVWVGMFLRLPNTLLRHTVSIVAIAVLVCCFPR